MVCALDEQDACNAVNPLKPKHFSMVPVVKAGHYDWENLSPSFLGVMAFLQHAPKKSSASKIKGFHQNSREIAQIVCGQNVGSIQFERPDPVELYFSLNDSRCLGALG